MIEKTLYRLGGDQGKRKSWLAIAVGLMATVFAGAAAAIFPTLVPILVFGAVGAAAIILRYYREGLLLLLFLAPLTNYVGSYIGFPGLSVGGAMRDALVVVLILGWALRRARSKEGRGQSISLAQGLVLCFVGLVGFFVLLSPDLPTAVMGFKNTTLYILLMFVASEAISSRHELKRVLVLVLMLGIILGLLAIGEVATHGEIVYTLGFREDYVRANLSSSVAALRMARPVEFYRTWRATAGLGNPLEYGTYATFICAIAVCLLLLAGDKFDRRVAASACLLAAISVVLSLARTAWLALFAALLTIAVLCRKSRFLVVLAAAGLIVVAGYSIFPDSPFYSRLLMADETTRLTTIGRIEIYRHGLTVVRQNPLGLGLGSQGAASGMFQGSRLLLITDNYYLQLGVDMGPVPVTLYLLMLVAMFWHAFKTYNEVQDTLLKAIALASAAIIVAILVANAVSSVIDSRVLSTYFWVLMGIMVSLPRIECAPELASATNESGPATNKGRAN